MPAIAITVSKMVRNQALTLPATVAVNATDGAAVNYSDCADERVLLILENAATSQKTATIKAGNGIQGVNDLEVTVPASGKVCLVIEGMKFKNVSGDNMGKVIVKGADTNIKVAAVQLP